MSSDKSDGRGLAAVTGPIVLRPLHPTLWETDHESSLLDQLFLEWERWGRWYAKGTGP